MSKVQPRKQNVEAMDGTLWRRHCKSVWNNRSNDEKTISCQRDLGHGNTDQEREGLTRLRQRILAFIGFFIRFELVLMDTRYLQVIVVSMETRHQGLGKPCLKLVIMLCRNCPSNMAGWSIQTTNERMGLFAECWSDHTNTHSHINNLRMCILNLCCFDFTLILCFRSIWNMRLFPPAALCSEERQHVLWDLFKV